MLLSYRAAEKVSRVEVTVSAHNNRMERGVMDQVLRRGRDGALLVQVMRARVREALACARSCERSAS
jgi:hypothetical protein